MLKFYLVIGFIFSGSGVSFGDCHSEVNDFVVVCGEFLFIN